MEGKVDTDVFEIKTRKEKCTEVTGADVCTSDIHTHERSHTHTHLLPRTHTHPSPHTHTHTRAHTHTHTHTSPHTHTPEPSQTHRHTHSQSSWAPVRGVLFSRNVALLNTELKHNCLNLSTGKDTHMLHAHTHTHTHKDTP